MRKIDKKLKKMVKRSKSLTHNEKTNILQKIKKWISKQKSKELCVIFSDEKKQFKNIENEYQESILGIKGKHQGDSELHWHNLSKAFIKELCDLIDCSLSIDKGEKQEWKDKIENDMNESQIQELHQILLEEKSA